MRSELRTVCRTSFVPDHYRLLAKVHSAIGARTAGYFGKGRKEFEGFHLAVPARADHGAEVWIYAVQN